MSERNVLGTELEPCGTDPVTGFYRDGTCTCGPTPGAEGGGPAEPGTYDVGLHAVCAVMTAEFLQHQQATGNDLVTPRQEWQFPGLVPGDRWCVVTARWHQAYADGVAAPVVLHATSERALELVPLEHLVEHSVDVPDDPRGLATP